MIPIGPPTLNNRRLERLPQVDKKATATKIITGYNQGMLKRGLTKTGQDKIEKIEIFISGNIQIVGSEFGVNSLKAWKHESILPFGIKVKMMFSLQVLGPFGYQLTNLQTYLSVIADHVHPFMTPVYRSSDGYFQLDNVPCVKAQIISNLFFQHDIEFTLHKKKSNLTSP